MRRSLRPLVVAVLCLSPLAASAEVAPFTLDDVVSLATIPAVSVSPDGRLAVFSVRTVNLPANGYRTKLWLVPTDGSAPARPLTFGDGGDTLPRWSPDGASIAFLSDRGGARQLWVLPRAGGEAQRITTHSKPITGFDWAPDSQRLLIIAPAGDTELEATQAREQNDAMRIGSHWRNDRLWVLRVDEGKLAPLTDADRHVSSAAWSPRGTAIAFLATPTPEADSSEEASAHIIDVASRQVRDVPGGSLASKIRWSPDGTALAFVRAFDGKGISREDLFVWTIVLDPLGSEDQSRNLTSTLDRDISDVSWTRDGRAIDVVFTDGVSDVVARIDATRGARQAAWNPGYTIDNLAHAGDTLVFVRSDRPAEVWIRAPGAEARQLTDVNPRVRELQIPGSEPFRWRGPAGDIEGVLTRPSGYEKGRRYPLIVNPHGGPRGASTLELSAQTCYFASLGYLVLRPNFRGSTGYGDAFTKGNVANWGDGPFRDMMAGVDALVAQGLADPDRLFLYGWSYGGFLTNWAITHTDRFRAAASGAGVSDLRMQYTISDARRWRFDYFRGSPFTGNQPIYERESPVTYAGQARVPTLFLHGQNDIRCPLANGLMMYRALKDVGVDTELVVYPREGHTFAEPRHIMDRLQRIVEWFKKHDRSATQ